MKKDDPEVRLKDLEHEIRNLERLEPVTMEQSELFFSKAMDASLPSGIAVIDDKGFQVYVNESFCKMVGRDRHELLGRHEPFSYWAEQDIDNIRKAFRHTLENNIPEEGFDLVFQHKSGRLIPVNVLISSFEFTDNRTYWIANVINITRRKSLEEALKRSQLLLKTNIESQKNTIVFSVDRKYNYLYFNSTHAEAMKFAYGGDVSIGKNFLNCITSDDDRNSLKQYIDIAFEGKSHSVIQSFGSRNIDYYEVFFNPIAEDNGQIIGCSSLARNITERMKAELSLRESETKFREIINQINDAIIVFDEQGKIIIWNSGSERLSGLKADDIINRNIADIQYQLTPPAKRDKAAIENAINGIIKMQTPEVFNQIIDSEMISLSTGKVKNIQSSVFPIRLNEDSLFCTVIRDNTDIKRYEKELLRISEDKDKFYSVIAQYLYHPFNLFHSFTKVMSEELDNLSIKEIQRMVDSMSKSASHLYSLLDNMLQYTRLNQGKIQFSPEELNLKTLCHDALSIITPSTGTKNIKIQYSLADEIKVHADAFMIKTVLRNLVNKAIKFTENEGVISVSARKNEVEVIITITISGSEADYKYLKRLFDISQIHTVLGEAEEKGSTLGLLLSKEFIEKHYGRLWIEDGKAGSCSIIFTLPHESSLNTAQQ